MVSVTHTEVVAAPRDIVFDVVADRSGYARFTSLRTVQLLTPGVDEPQGVGAVHKLSALGPLGPREQVIESVRPDRMAYRVVGGLPVRDHVGTIVLSDNGDGTTRFDYTMDSTSALPVPAALYRRILKATILLLAKPIAKEAARRAALA